MIGYLRGDLLENTDGKVLVGVSGVGYQVTIPGSPSYLGFVPGKPVELFIHTHVREDALDLYGFASRAEKELFLTLLSVNGIGPKGALGLLSKIGPSTLISAVLTGDKDALTEVPGVGKKTAERIVLELADSLKKKMEAGSLGELRVEKAAKTKAAAGAAKSTESTMMREARDALLGLGYREPEIAPALSRAMEKDPQPKRVEDLIRTALQQLG